MEKSVDLNLVRKITAALLPDDYREHILGDLEERGFRLRDVVSVLPRIWLSHLRRSPWSPVVYFAAWGGYLAALIGMPYGVAAIVVSIFAVAGLCNRFVLQQNMARFRILYQVFLVQAAERILPYLWPSVTRPQRAVFFIASIFLFIGLPWLRARRFQKPNNNSPNEAILTLQLIENSGDSAPPNGPISAPKTSPPEGI